MNSYKNDYYFYLGGVVSITLFLFFSLVFILFIAKQSEIKHIQLNSSTYIAINMNSIPDAPAIKVKKSRVAKKKVEKIEKIQKPKKEKKAPDTDKKLETIQTDQEAVNTDISSLFGQLKTKKLVKRKSNKKLDIVDAKLIKKIQKRIKTKELKRVDSSKASSLVKNLKASKKSIEVVGDSVGVVDKYLAKIHAQIYSKFFPPADSAGESAKVRLELDKYGTVLSYRVLVGSKNDLFNEAVVACMKSLHQLTPHPDNKAVSLNIILTAKDK